MTGDTQQSADRRNSLLEALQREFSDFERKEGEFRKKDREERAAELRLPLDKARHH
jgi:hypothetical protein